MSPQGGFKFVKSKHNRIFIYTVTSAQSKDLLVCTNDNCNFDLGQILFPLLLSKRILTTALKVMNFNSSEIISLLTIESIEQSAPPPPRLVSTDYCRCGKCKTMPTVAENVCCQELKHCPHIMEGGCFVYVQPKIRFFFHLGKVQKKINSLMEFSTKLDGWVTLYFA